MILICCTGGNRRFTKIIKEYGFKYGAQLPCNVESDLYFADQDWKNPKASEYFSQVALYRPKMATVLDLERPEQMNEVMEWALIVSRTVEQLVIIPKYNGAIEKIPREINGKEVILGYSVPSLYGGTTVPRSEFKGWPVHLLGGEPFLQRGIRSLLEHEGAKVVSMDCNYIQKMATRFCQFFTIKPTRSRNKHFPTLKEAGIITVDGHIKAFELSCEALRDLYAV